MGGWVGVVSWCFESSQPLGVTSGLNTNSNLSPSYPAHKSFNINHTILQHNYSIKVGIGQNIALQSSTSSRKKPTLEMSSFILSSRGIQHHFSPASSSKTNKHTNKQQQENPVCYEQLVSWCFEPSQPQRITSELNTNFILSPNYSVNTSSYHKSCF